MIEDLERRYLAAMHKVQSGVAAKMEIDPKDVTPKSLRVGVNSSLLNNGALLHLLIDKGIITHEEFLEVLVDYAEREALMYEQLLSERYHTNIHLG
jgi:hypothetical protein